MPVSPADFEFYSRMTGQPVPNTPAGRMAIAPQVYNMRRGGGGFGRMLRGAARGALAAGALAGAGALALAVDDEMAKTKPSPAAGSVDLDKSPSKTAQASALRDKADRLIKSLRDPSPVGDSPIGDSGYKGPSYVNRYSGQTVVPEADANVDFESHGAQIASTSTPTETRAEVRQQPSSGVQVTDLSNVAAKDYVAGKVEPGTEMITNREANQLAQQFEFYEATPHGSPFQAEGAMDMLNDQRRFAEAQEKEIARDILADFAKEKKSRMAGSVLTTAGDLSEEDVGAQTVLFPKSGMVKGVSIYPSAMGEGGTGRADVTYKKGDQGRYVYMLSKEGQERAQNIAAGAESVGERASAFLKDMTKKGQLISMDPESKAPYGIKPKLSEIL